ncbi:HpcH/HpaI aldolase family protein [Candidatus Pantoea soli]|uniref:4-hydroxy-2-oxovalerate aldolase n=1 Tax=Candidatus Pantoea soli TaxID=3098669 RepID=A0A518XII8_9GAMM|nr:aldolase/citrate lyase family protein [Pantoea soli]QDY44010.1 4-hydroxy-2-oxovalerate aldolase [Pantoea soli]
MIALTSPEQRLQTKPALFGLLNSVPHPTIVEMIATAGYDFVLLDLEHLPHNETLLSQCIQLAQQHHCAPLVRITVDDIPRAGRLLDMGAHGIVLSRAESAQQVAALRDAMFFPPAGTRGITGGSVTGFGTLPLAEYIRQANERLWLVPMIETPDGVAAIDSILRIPQVTLVMEGALDLAMSMQLGPQPTHPEVEAQLHLLASRCAAAGKRFCANPRTPEQRLRWREQGIDCWLCGEDRGFLFRTLQQRLHELSSS